MPGGEGSTELFAIGSKLPATKEIMERLIGNLFDPTVLLSLAMVLYAGALYFWFVRRNPVRSILILFIGCGLLHLTLQRYHSLLNSPSLHLLLALFWLVPALLYLTSHDGFDFRKAGPVGESPGDSHQVEDSGAAFRFGESFSYISNIAPGLVVVLYVLIFCLVFFTSFTSDLLFVLLLQPGLLLTALYVLLYLVGSRPDPVFLFSALAFFFAVIWFLSYAPLAQPLNPTGAGGDDYNDPARMWPVHRGYLAFLWAVASFAILRDALDRLRIMVWFALVLFSALIQYQMGALPVYLGTALIGGGILAGVRFWRDRRVA